MGALHLHSRRSSAKFTIFKHAEIRPPVDISTRRNTKQRLDPAGRWDVLRINKEFAAAKQVLLTVICTNRRYWEL